MSATLARNCHVSSGKRAHGKHLLAQEMVQCGQAVRGLEAQGVWKANELRLAKARERLLLSQLDSAEAAARNAQAQVHVACCLLFRQGSVIERARCTDSPERVERRRLLKTGAGSACPDVDSSGSELACQ